MKRYPWFRAVWIGVNILLAASVFLLIYGSVWEYSTRRYLKGFSDAIVPLSAPPEQKVDAILAWMARGPARRSIRDVDPDSSRDPQVTLEYKRLLQVCGTATNAFVNVAASSGLEARRLLLLGADRRAMHVVAEVLVGGRWIVVDPAFRFAFRNARGDLLTVDELRDPDVLRAATRAVPNYPPEYTFAQTAYVRLARIPLIGQQLRGALDAVFPSWERAINWTRVLERSSMALTLVAAFLIFSSVVARFILNWYAVHRLGILRVRLREQILRAGAALFENPR